MSEDSRPKENLLVTTPSERPPITRRDFLRIAGSSFGFLVGALLYELRTGGLGELTRSAINFLVSKEVLEEGNPAQRAAVLERILRVASLKSGLERKNYGEEVIVPWFKLNLVEQFGQAANYHLAAKLLRHFLYGRGTPVDITNDYLQGAIEISHNLFPSLSKDEALERFILGELELLGDSRLMKPGDAKLASSIEEFKEAVANGKPYHLRLIAQSYSSEGAGADKIKFALGSYGMIVEGNVTEITTGPSDLDGRKKDDWVYVLKLAPGTKITIYDTYNWKDTPDDPLRMRTFYAGELLEKFLYSLGYKDTYKVIDLLGVETWEKLSKMKILSYTHPEIKKLVNEGLAHEFEVRGNFELKDQLTIKLSKTIFD